MIAPEEGLTVDIVDVEMIATEGVEMIALETERRRGSSRMTVHSEENLARPKNRSIAGQIKILIQEFAPVFCFWAKPTLEKIERSNSYVFIQAFQKHRKGIINICNYNVNAFVGICNNGSRIS
jgi:hypothetical protein